MLISIITINYNHLAGLKKTMQSVLEQTYSKIEYIIIDGGSTDGSKEYIESKDKNLAYWVSEPDKGIYHAMNKGIDQATGDYVLFLNSGDWLVGAEIVDVISKNFGDCDILFGNLIKVSINQKQLIDKGPQSSNLTLNNFFVGTLNHPSTFIKRDLFKKYGKYDESLKIVSDWKFFLIAIGLNDSVVKYLDTEISYFDMTGLSNSNLKARKDERDLVLKSLLPLRIYNDYNNFKNLSKILKNPRVQSLMKLEKFASLRKVNAVWFKFLLLFVKVKN